MPSRLNINAREDIKAIRKKLEETDV